MIKLSNKKHWENAISPIAIILFWVISWSQAVAQQTYEPFKFVASYSTLGHEIGHFNRPEEMAFSPNGKYLAVSDTHNNRVQLFSVDSNASPSLSLSLKMVYGDIWPWDNRIIPSSSNDAYREKDYFDGNSMHLTGRAYQHRQGRIRPSKDIPMDYFNLPVGIAWLGTNTLLIADTGNHRMKAIKLNGEIQYILGQEGWKDGYFHHPLGIDTSWEGEIYVTEPRSKYIRGLGLDFPFPQRQRVQGNRLQIFDQNLKSTRRLGHMHHMSGIDYRQFKDITRVMVNIGGDIYLTDSGNHRIMIFDKALNKKKELIEWPRYKMRYPNGIDLSLDGRLAIADTGNHKVLIIDQNYKLIQVIGVFGAQDGEFIKPHAVRFGPHGNLYVLDTGNSRIQVFSGTKVRQFPRYPEPEVKPEPMILPKKLKEVLPPPTLPKDSM